MISSQGCTVDWKFIWKLKVPMKIKVFLWKVHLNILHTKVFVASRGIMFDESICCSLCGKVRETTEHIFFRMLLVLCGMRWYNGGTLTQFYHKSLV